MAIERPQWNAGQITAFHERMMGTRISPPGEDASGLYLRAVAPGVELAEKAFGLAIGPSHAFAFFFEQEIERQRLEVLGASGSESAPIAPILLESLQQDGEYFMQGSTTTYAQQSGVDQAEVGLYLVTLQALAIGAVALFYEADPPTEAQLGELVKSARAAGTGLDPLITVMNAHARARQEMVREMMGASGYN